MQRVKLLKEIINAVKDVKVCDTGTSYFASDHSHPVCLIGTARKLGIALPNDIEFSGAFAEYFKVSKSEAYKLLYLNGNNNMRLTSGMDYYNAGNRMLAHYGETHA